MVGRGVEVGHDWDVTSGVYLSFHPALPMHTCLCTDASQKTMKVSIVCLSACTAMCACVCMCVQWRGWEITYSLVQAKQAIGP